MKLLRHIVFFAISIFLFHYALPTSINAVDPFPPFSKEGNPDEQYLMEEIFPLFRYIKPAQLKVYENQDRSRQYEALEVCTNGDRRDSTCNNLKGDGRDECTGGEVDLCYKGQRSGVAKTARSTHGSCTATDADPPGTVGKCRYLKNPSVKGEVKATDFSEIIRAAPSLSNDTPDPGITNPDLSDSSQTPLTPTALGLIYSKLQNEQLRYSATGTDNPITWGSHRLQLTQGEQIIKQLLVVMRAKQTKDTVSKTKEWPLGWVDWGYQTANGKTLIAIRDELPAEIAGAGQVIVEASDDFFLNAGNLDAVSNMAEEKELVVAKVLEASSQNPQPVWVADLLQAPVYPPSFRQGYARGSICVFDLCCPGIYCPFPDSLVGNSKALYADTSVSQAFNAALDDLFLNYSLQEASKIFKDLVAGNQLIRFAGSAAPNAVPSAIHRRLSAEISNPCFKYVPKPEDFTFGWFGFHMDYVKPNSFFDPEKKCPDWGIQPELTKEKGGAIPASLLANLINLLWGHREDDVSPVTRHLITIPDAMGQYLSEIEDPVFQIRDTLAENERQNKYNQTLSNVLDASTTFYFAGKGIPVGDSKRRLGLFSCADPDYSAPELTSIESYALGTRIGCFDNAASAGSCTGEQFTKLFGETNQLPLPAAVTQIMSSKMFVDGALNPELDEAYAQVAKETGVPCEVLAGHHFEEATSRFFGEGKPEEYSAANGSFVGKNGFLESVRNAAKGVLRHPPTSLEGLITTMSYFNGGGNSNCQLDFPAPIPWGGCPKSFDGDDDPYATNLLDSRHTGMYLLYCGDFQICNPPKPYGERPGAFPAALVVHNVIKNGSSGSPSPQTPSPTPSSQPSSGVQKVNPEGICGDGFIDTGLGCLPFERDAFIATLLGAIAGISGLIALVTMLIATFQIMTAAGDSKKVSKGRELFMAALTGLLFVVFSVTLLRIIAGDIIKLPGFN